MVSNKCDVTQKFNWRSVTNIKLHEREMRSGVNVSSANSYLNSLLLFNESKQLNAESNSSQQTPY